MPSICIRLDPDLLPNTTADVRYELPALLVERSAGAIREDGYDYGKASYRMFVFLDVDDIETALPVILDVLENVPIPNEILGPAALVATSATDHCDRAEKYSIVFPSGNNDPFTFD